jgi:hypothetical protein
MGTSGFWFDYNEWSRCVYAIQGQSVIEVDLDREVNKGELALSDIAPRIVRTLPGMSDVLAVVADQVELFDLRSERKRIVALGGGNPVFDVWSDHQTPFRLAIAERRPAIAVTDLRYPSQTTRFALDTDLPTVSFAGQQNGQTVAIGTDGAVWLVDLTSGAAVEKTAFGDLPEFHPVTQCTFSPQRFALAMVQADTNIIVLSS